MFAIEGKRPVSWEQFKEELRTNGEHFFTAIDQQRHEDCSIPPGPGNDVIVAPVLVIWTDTMITTLKTSSIGDWPQALETWNTKGSMRM
jgi:hypothetical protein